MPTLSLSFARQCLLNSLHLLGSYELKQVKSIKMWRTLVKSVQMGMQKNTRVGLQLQQTPCQSIRENLKIKQAIADLAFVELELGNPVRALFRDVSLLNPVPECSRACAFLGHVYVAEALCLLDRPKEVAEHLSNYFHDRGMTVDLPYCEEDWRQWQVKKTVYSEDVNNTPAQMGVRTPVSEEQQDNMLLSPMEAPQALYVNIVSMYAMHGELEIASRFASQDLVSGPENQQITLIAVYLDLKLGNTQEALTKLKRLCRVTFLPLRSSTPNVSS